MPADLLPAHYRAPAAACPDALSLRPFGKGGVCLHHRHLHTGHFPGRFSRRETGRQPEIPVGAFIGRALFPYIDHPIPGDEPGHGGCVRKFLYRTGPVLLQRDVGRDGQLISPKI